MLSPAERSLLEVLEKSLGGGFRVFSKIRLADVVEVKKGLSQSAARRAVSAISANYVDFLICGASDLSIRCAIRLEDLTHNTSQGDPSGLFVNKVLEASQIPLLRVKPRSSYSISEITRLLENCGIIKVEKRQTRPIGVQVEKKKEDIKAKIEPEKIIPSIELETEALCPRCGAGLVEKVATKGKYAGQKYLGCSNFPHCRYAEVIKQ
ncbi:MAG: DUF2726 domain-containing protein [Desulfosarcinaceae bacterium]